jgi:N4-gp56 family major capsid protein
MAQIYGKGDDASINGNGTTQIQQQYYYKKALIDLVKEQHFMPLADVRSMPKNFGKKIKQYHYLPLLDDRNVNDQGIDATGATISNGNLYGSSKDIGTISGKLPVLSETGGRVNRVGYKRLELEGSFQKFGFFDEYTQESLDFDTDAELEMHVTREALRGANYMTEAALQIDLLNAAGVVRYAGVATSNSTVTGEGDTPSVVNYTDLMKLGISLDNNRCPKQTTYIKGSTMFDTATIPSARTLFIGTELIPLIRGMKDLFGNQAFIPVQRYAAAGAILPHEYGTIDQFRIIVNLDMANWAGAGADATDKNQGYRTTNKKYDVFPMLTVGSGSFTAIGFQTDGKTVKFVIKHKKPSDNITTQDPYGEVGFHSIKWYYGFMALRPEWIGVIKTVAPI